VKSSLLYTPIDQSSILVEASSHHDSTPLFVPLPPQPSCAMTSSSPLHYRPALSAMMTREERKANERTRHLPHTEMQQQEAVRRQMMQQATLQSPYKSKQAIKGLGRNAPKSMQAKMKRSQSVNRLEPLQDAPQPTLSQTQQWEQQQQQQQQQSPHQSQQQSPINANSGSVLLPPMESSESFESRAYRSLPAHSAASSHYYVPVQGGSRGASKVHVHQYRDGSVCEECTCERGNQLVAQDEAQEEKSQPSSQQQSRPPPALGSTVLPPSLLARSQRGAIPVAIRAPDSSRQRSVYASSFKAMKVDSFQRQGRGYFASLNKSYIRSCLADPGFGFNLDELKRQGQNDPSLEHFAAEIEREAMMEPEQRRAMKKVPEEHLMPQSTHHMDFKPPSPELIKSYKRVGRDYRQAGNKSFIGLNFVNDERVLQQLPPDVVREANARQKGGLTADQDPGASIPFGTVRVPFVAETTHKSSFVPHSTKVVTRASVVFGGESKPEENIWAGRWDDNTIDPAEAELLHQQLHQHS